MGNEFLAELAAAGALLHSQNARILKHRFPDSSNIPDGTLLPLRLVGEEGLSKNFSYKLECLSASAFVQHKDLFGQPIEVSLLLPDGGERLFTGLVTRVESNGSDGGFSRWSLTIEPALAILGYRRNSRVFQSKSVIEIVSAILDEHIAANPAIASAFKYESRVSQACPERSYCLQYRETDLAFIERLLAEEGISYRYVHGADPDHSIRATNRGSSNDSETPTHTLILFDSDYPHAQSPVGTVRFHRTDGVETEDAIDQWEGLRQLQSGRSSLNTFDYKTVSQYPVTSDQYTQHGDGGAALTSSLESYDPQALYYGSDPGDMERYAENRQRARDLASKLYYGGGTDRSIQDGAWKELLDHPVHDQDNQEDRQFLVLSHQFEARNNLLPDDPPALGGLLASSDSSNQNEPPYRNTFTAVRRHIPVAPDYEATRHQKPTAGGLTTATVVGPASEEIFTDALGRIKIQFHWQRPQDHPEGGANYDDNSSTWVRVAYTTAGAEWGTQGIPRIGQEVIVSFIENDIDRPIVISVVHNGTHKPPTFSGAGTLPANKTLSGIKTKEYKGGGYNELLFDDSTNQIRAKLSSEHGKTQLNQGYLIHPRLEGKGDPRGNGFELRTDAAGALRAAKGLLLSTDARLDAQGKQLDRQELIGLMKLLESVQQELSKLSAQHSAEDTDTAKLTETRENLENWEMGSNTQPKGDAAKGGRPLVAVTAPAGIALASADNMALGASSHIDVASAKNTQISAGRKFLVRAAEQISLFVHELGMKLFAAKGKIEIQTHSDNVEVTAAKKIVLTALEEVIIQAPKLTWIANGAQIDMGGGAITGQCSGAFTQKAGTHTITGPGGGTPATPNLPTSELKTDERFVVRYRGDNEPVKNRRYEIKLDNGRVITGRTDEQGRTALLQDQQMRIANLTLFKD